ncbi:50S ribosomal protein L25/general stress protein Ctc [Bacillus chungangensis]|uniref:Large ribosomal subunit protein bL25 n=1 Tax=Bacillus chungangensis TaxID=587633 RepID=A0ABT9WXR4_9BACI|nr:50S ribosomal protein L25/general stress protein Ctc [Bacillus chungangensis]MDQ0177903.1 large subunit ribosomal protein L25 [Bacillus chungangensis]
MVTILEAKSRKSKKKSEINQLRKTGKIPAVVYGFKTENTPIAVDERDFIKTIREVGRNGVISLQIDGEKQNVLLNEYQEDTLQNKITHIDFIAVDMSQEIEASVRVELVGEAEGVKSGGVLQQPLFELSVLAKPDKIPEFISLDISTLQIGDSLSVGDIKNDGTYTINHDENETIASVLAPRVEEADDEEAKEPEATGEGEKES